MRWLAAWGLILGAMPATAQVWLPSPGGVVVQGPGWSFGYSCTPPPYVVGYLWPSSWMSYSQQIIIQPPRVVLPPRRAELEPLPSPPRRDDQAEKVDQKFREAVARGEFLVIEPGPLKLGEVEVAPPVRVPPVVLTDEMPPADPKSRGVFYVKQAQSAFRAGWYGVATEQLEAATRADPAQPLPWFLLAQVRLARGHYREAVLAIQAGMKLAPDWPATPFKLGQLYGEDPKLYAEHLSKLKAAQQHQPDDPLLAFLLGYQYWFLGERAAAVKLLRQASAAVRDNDIIERFLQEAEG